MPIFEQVFSGAHLVDIDLSRWDKRVVLYVLADRMGYRQGNRLPMFAAEFIRVSRLEIAFSHLLDNVSVSLAGDEHVQWVLYEYSIRHFEHGLEVTLWGLPSTPRMTLVSEDVIIREVASTQIDAVFPGWNKPFGGFVRPGLDMWTRGEGPKVTRP